MECVIKYIKSTSKILWDNCLVFCVYDHYDVSQRCYTFHPRWRKRLIRLFNVSSQGNLNIWSDFTSHMKFFFWILLSSQSCRTIWYCVTLFGLESQNGLNMAWSFLILDKNKLSKIKNSKAVINCLKISKFVLRYQHLI